MGTKNRNPNARNRGAQNRMMHNFSAFIDELDFLPGVSGLRKNVHLRQHVERDWMRKNLGFILLAPEVRARLKRQLVYCSRAGTRNRLIARCNDPAYAKLAVQGIQPHERYDRRAVRIGNNSFLPRKVRRIYLG